MQVPNSPEFTIIDYTGDVMKNDKKYGITPQTLDGLKSADKQIELAIKTLLNITLKMSGIFEGRCSTKCGQCVRCMTRDSLKDPQGIEQVSKIISSELSQFSNLLIAIAHPVKEAVKDCVEAIIPTAEYDSKLDKAEFDMYSKAYTAVVDQITDRFKQ